MYSEQANARTKLYSEQANARTKSKAPSNDVTGEGQKKSRTKEVQSTEQRGYRRRMTRTRCFWKEPEAIRASNETVTRMGCFWREPEASRASNKTCTTNRIKVYDFTSVSATNSQVVVRSKRWNVRDTEILQDKWRSLTNDQHKMLAPHGFAEYATGIAAMAAHTFSAAKETVKETQRWNLTHYP